MPITSALFRGLIYAGSTSLASTIVVEQTGPLQLTVRAGSFTTTGDVRQGVPPETHTLAADQVLDLTAHATYPTAYRAFLVTDGVSADVLLQSRVLDGIEDWPDPPAGWQIVHQLVYEFVVPAGATDLSAVEIPVLTVLPGFPPGTTAADWRLQTGVI